MTRRGFLALAATVRDHSIGRLLERELPAGMEYTLIDTAAASVSARRWEDASRPVPLGSLVKPFLALAYAESHGLAYPRFLCQGCWKPAGHRRIGITAALAQSCNSYFLQLARRTAIEDVERVAATFSLPMPESTQPEGLIGLLGAWRATPETIALAYSEFAQRRSEPQAQIVFQALRQCARTGTASGVGCDIAAKTGTAPCAHPNHSEGDGLLIAILRDHVLLTRAHGVTGAECARRTGPALRQVLR